MPLTYRIAKTSKMGDYSLLGEKSKVSKDLFWESVEKEVKDFTADMPGKYEQILTITKMHLEKQTSVTINDTWFEIKGRR